MYLNVPEQFKEQLLLPNKHICTKVQIGDINFKRTIWFLVNLFKKEIKLHLAKISIC